jgi:hypothetical protein
VFLSWTHGSIKAGLCSEVVTLGGDGLEAVELLEVVPEFLPATV